MSIRSKRVRHQCSKLGDEMLWIPWSCVRCCVRLSRRVRVGPVRSCTEASCAVGSVDEVVSEVPLGGVETCQHIFKSLPSPFSSDP